MSTNQELIAEARKLAIGYDILTRLAGQEIVTPNIVTRLADALEMAESKFDVTAVSKAIAEALDAAMDYQWLEELEAIDIITAVLNETGQDWQPIVTAPKDGTNILIWDKTWHKQPYVATWQTADLYWLEVGTGLTLSPTHWMPLPAPPKETL